MTYISVTCHNCGGVFPLYRVDGEHMACPHCAQNIPAKAVKKMRDAMGAVAEINKDLRKAHDDNGNSLFQIEVSTHYVSADKFDLY